MSFSGPFVSLHGVIIDITSLSSLIHITGTVDVSQLGVLPLALAPEQSATFPAQAAGGSMTWVRFAVDGEFACSTCHVMAHPAAFRKCDGGYKQRDPRPHTSATGLGISLGG